MEVGFQPHYDVSAMRISHQVDRSTGLDWRVMGKSVKVVQSYTGLGARAAASLRGQQGCIMGTLETNNERVYRNIRYMVKENYLQYRRLIE